MQLPFKRFVKQVSNGGSFSRYGYIEMMQRNAKALETAPWREAKCAASAVSLTVNQVTRTDGEADSDTGAWTTPPTYTAWFDDRYDVFNQAGDGVQRMASMCGYSGCVAYRFTLPTSNQSALDSISITVQRDRYLRAGVRIATCLSTAETPDAISWSLARGSQHSSPSTAPVDGTVGVESWGFLGQPNVPYLLAGRAEQGTWTAGSSETPFYSSAAISANTYLYVFLTLEDPAGYWDWYSAKDARFYYIEGSAVLVPSLCEFNFASDETVAPDDTVWSSSFINDPGNLRTEMVSQSVPLGALFGEAGKCHNMAAIFAASRSDHKDWEAPFNVLRHGPGALRFTGDPDAGASEAVNYCKRDASVALKDTNLLASPNSANAGYNGLFVLARKLTSEGSAPVTANVPEDASVAASLSRGKVTQLYLGWQPLRVPFDLPRYTTMRLTPRRFRVTGADPAGGTLRFGVDLDINVWRLSGSAATHWLNWMLLSAFASNPAFFTAAKSSISASVTTDGRIASTIEGKVQLVGQFDGNTFGILGGSGAAVTVDIGEALPGDLIILTPNVRRLYSENYTHTSSPALTTDGSICYFGGSHDNLVEANLNASWYGLDGEKCRGVDFLTEFS